MKKPILFTYMIIITLYCCACSDKNQQNNHDVTYSNIEIDIPYYEDFKAFPLYYLNDNEIVAVYIKAGSEKQSKICMFNIDTKEFNIIYEGDYLINAFGNIFYKLNEGFLLQTGYNRLLFDKEKNDLKEYQLDIGPKVDYLLIDPNLEYVIENETNHLYLRDINDNSRIKFNIPDGRYRTRFKWNNAGDEFIYLSDYTNAVIVDINSNKSSNFRGNEDFSYPDGFVEYGDIYYTSDEESIILSCICEEGNVFQIIDKQTGNLINVFEGTHDSYLFDIFDEYLLFSSGEKNNQNLVLYNYINDTQEVLTSLEGQYICGASINKSTNQVAFITYGFNERIQKLHIISLEN